MSKLTRKKQIALELDEELVEALYKFRGAYMAKNGENITTAQVVRTAMREFFNLS